MCSPQVAFYGDDFTGSVDVLLQFARRGWRGRLFVGVPDAALLDAAARECDVVGIAGIARSLPTGDLDREVRPAFEALLRLGPHVVQYKACSTADSSPAIGSLGRVIEIGRDVVGEGTVPLLFAQPDFGRYTLFGHHFAREGSVVHRLDRQPTMSTHPSTPMTESDLARHLSQQTALPIGGIPFTSYRTPSALRDDLRASDAAAVVLDAADDAHLILIGEAVLGLPAPVFALGSGGLSHGLAAARPGPGGGVPSSTPSRGPVLAVSGSRSATTRRQMDVAADAGWLTGPLPADPASLPDTLGRVVDALAAGRSVALGSDGADLSHAGADALPAIARAAAVVIDEAVRARATRRVIVCGGDTSSRVVTLLGVSSLSLAANPTANVVLLTAQSADPAIDGLEMLLKGGQVGDDDLFVATRALGGGPA
ncbi:four-carbon acid sugar kinase family protein [Microbacterium sp. Marseille-Q6648]|uniref:four-carbon acid sugar kinase family protein n=1 Tax=Microbacterium sp. Marseille-Q6648 TaxID=2937991 RepID=UPI00203D36C0|nr:four-carbon acid sugar kinase family protein [Microbacterium sp. Marseille-Q6648]